MFITQNEVCQRLRISKPVHNKLRRCGLLPNTYPGVRLYWWPAILAAIDRNAGIRDEADDSANEQLPRFLARGRK